LCLSSAAICLWKSFRRSRTPFRDQPETVRLHPGTGVHLHPGILFEIISEHRSESSRNRVHLAPDSPSRLAKATSASSCHRSQSTPPQTTYRHPESISAPTTFIRSASSNVLSAPHTRATYSSPLKGTMRSSFADRWTVTTWCPFGVVKLSANVMKVVSATPRKVHPRVPSEIAQI
jgi:hypothetical protein